MLLVDNECTMWCIYRGAFYTAIGCCMPWVGRQTLSINRWPIRNYMSAALMAAVIAPAWYQFHVEYQECKKLKVAKVRKEMRDLALIDEHYPDK